MGAKMTEEQRWPEPAYLTKDHAINMTLRDYFAARVMQGLLATDIDCGPKYAQIIADNAYGLADAMLKAREKK
jgi:hypothetical protein